MANPVIQQLNHDWNEHLEDLKSLVRIPSVSFPDFPTETLDQSAAAVEKLFRKSGLENTQILKMGNAFPYVYGDWLHAPGKPTLLLYAHHDVQPPGREEVWKTPPFQPVEKEGPGGLRLFGRGTADDKAGIIVHTAAIASYLRQLKKLPVNVKVVIEGEEEIGSTHLYEFLKKYRTQLAADILVLTDTLNFDCGIPALTTALRGMVGVEIEVKALSKTVHSGMWGGPIPDPTQALAKMLAGLTDDQGRIALPEIRAMIPPLKDEEAERFRELPYDEARFREQVGLIPGATLLKEGPSPIAQTWRYPSLTINAVQASSKKNAGNIINDVAWARVTLRLCAGMDPLKTQQILLDHLRKQVPWGLEITLESDTPAGPWSVSDSPAQRRAFEAAERALELGYGRKPYRMGCGGSIPFVEPFAQALGNIPALLVGVEDPFTNAHGENESLLLSDFQSACRSQIHLFHELGSAH